VAVVPAFWPTEGVTRAFSDLAIDVQDSAGAQPVVSRAAPAAEAAVPFIDLGDLRSGGARDEVRLELGAGIVLSIARS